MRKPRYKTHVPVMGNSNYALLFHKWYNYHYLERNYVNCKTQGEKNKRKPIDGTRKYGSSGDPKIEL